MSLRLPPPRRPARIDVSLAIVNIVLLLIFFFLIAGRLDLALGTDIEVARTQDLPLDRLPRPVLVVTPESEWLLDGAPVSPELLAIALEGFSPDIPLHLVMDRRAPAEQLAALLTRAEFASRPVRLVTIRQPMQ